MGSRIFTPALRVEPGRPPASALMRGVWAVLILIAVLAAFLFALGSEVWWAPWMVPLALAAIYAMAYLNERSVPAGYSQETLVALVGIGAVGLSATAVLLGRWVRR